MNNDIMEALQKLIDKCRDSLEKNQMLLSEDEMELISYLSAWYDGYRVRKQYTWKERPGDF